MDTSILDANVTHGVTRTGYFARQDADRRRNNRVRDARLRPHRGEPNRPCQLPDAATGASTEVEGIGGGRDVDADAVDFGRRSTGTSPRQRRREDTSAGRVCQTYKQKAEQDAVHRAANLLRPK